MMFGQLKHVKPQEAYRQRTRSERTTTPQRNNCKQKGTDCSMLHKFVDQNLNAMISILIITQIGIINNNKHCGINSQVSQYFIMH